MITVDALTLNDSQAWKTASPASRSVFASWEYAQIASRQSGTQARLFLYQSPTLNIAYPYFLRTTRSLPFLAGLLLDQWDTLTPEYTGPQCAEPLLSHTVSAFQRAFSDYCRREHIVTEFVHINPWHCAYELLVAQDIHLDREIIYIDLTLDKERLWQESFSRACRKNIRRAQREGILVFPATTEEHIHEFHRIYSLTMERNQAAERYFFSPEYFLAFFTQMPKNAKFMLAAKGDQIVAGTLYLHDKSDVYSYLGGADHDYQQMRPTNAIIYHTIQWAQRKGKQRLVLGGGYQPGDGIFRFKASFSPLRAPFHVYRHVHDRPTYQALCRAWEQHFQVPVRKDYFPPYRAGISL